MSAIRIIKNISALAIGEVITRILSLILIIYIARFLGDTGFGKYSFAFAFTSLFLVLVDPGINTVVIRDVAREKKLAGKYLGNIIILKSLLSLIAFFFLVIVINLMDYPDETKLAVYIVGIYTIMTSFSQLTRSIFRAFEKMEYEAMLNILERLIFVSMGIVVLLLGYGLIEVVSVFLIAGTANIMLSFFLTASRFAIPKFEVDRRFLKYLFKEALPFGVAFIFVTIYIKADTVILSFMKGDAAVGWYNAAYQIPLALTLVSAALMESVFPVFSNLYRSSKEALCSAYEKIFRLLSIIVLPIAIGVTLLSEKIILLLYGKGYENSIIILQILIWFIIFEFLSYLLYITLASINKQRINTISTGICASLNIILNVILIPQFGIMGSAIAKIITYFTLFIINFYFISKYLCRISLFKTMNKTIIAGLAMGLILFLLRDMHLLISVTVSGIFYIFFLFIIKGFTKEDLKLFCSR
jgi:O-antigen/teichoic acid export membrane protein